MSPSTVAHRIADPGHAPSAVVSARYDQNPTFNVSTAIHAQQGVAGISLSGADPQWLNGSGWSFSGQDYLTDTAIYQLTATNSALKVTVTEQDFSPRGITFPTSTETGSPPVNGLYVKRLSIQNTDTASHTFDVSYRAVTTSAWSSQSRSRWSRTGSAVQMAPARR